MAADTSVPQTLSQAELRRERSQEDLQEEQPWGSDSPARLRWPMTPVRVSWEAIAFSPLIISKQEWGEKEGKVGEY